MIAVNMLRYHNTYTMKMTDAQLHALKLTVELLDEQFKEKNGVSNYEAILLEESKKVVAQSI